MGDFFEDLLGQSDRESAARAAQDAALHSARYQGHGGASGSVRIRGDGTVGLDSDLGNLGPLRNMLLQLSGGNLAQSTQGLPPEFLRAASGAMGALGPVNTGNAGSFDFANQLMKSGLFSGLQKQLQGGASSAVSAANQDTGVIANQQLGLLREQAKPFEERAFSDLQDNLFATGRSGTTGGGIQTEAFARGLGQADLSRQLSALDVARGVQTDAVNRAGSFGGQLAGLRGLEDSLVNTGFGRALQGAGLNANRALDRFSVAGSVLDSSLRKQGTQQGLGLQSLAGVQGIDAQGLQSVMAALDAALGRSGSQANVASILSGLSGQKLGAGMGLFDFLGGIAGGAAQPQAV